MDAVRFKAMTPMPGATVVRPRQAAVVPVPSSHPSTPFATVTATYPTNAAELAVIGCGVGSSRWTNARAVNMKATKAFGHGPDRLLEHST